MVIVQDKTETGCFGTTAVERSSSKWCVSMLSSSMVQVYTLLSDHVNMNLCVCIAGACACLLSHKFPDASALRNQSPPPDVIFAFGRISG